MILKEIHRINKKQIMWYPSSGSDFRPIHNCNFNNFFIDIKTYFFNDISGQINIETIEKIDEITLEKQSNESIYLEGETYKFKKQENLIILKIRRA